MDAPAPQPLCHSLPRITRHDAALARLRGDARIEQRIGLPGPDWQRVHWQARGDAGRWALGLVWANALTRLTLRLSEDFDATATLAANAEAWEPALRLACLEALARELLPRQIEWAEGLGLAFCGVPDPAVDGHGAGPLMQWRSGQRRLGIDLHSDDLAWIERARSGLATRPVDLTPVASVPVPLGLLLGRRRIGIDVLRRLGIGDAVLFSQTADLTHLPWAQLLVGRIGAGALCRPCRVEHRNIVLLEGSWMSEQTMADAASGERSRSVASGAGDPLSGIEVDVHLVLQVLSTPLRELAAMRTGQVLELPLAAGDATVDLLVGGQLFGRAQLVCVGDRLGALIQELNHDAR
jgi:type III secretion system YscQ/HrcQ family protein